MGLRLPNIGLFALPFGEVFAFERLADRAPDWLYAST